MRAVALENQETVECPFCLDRMRAKNLNGSMWLVCPNGCPTELEMAPRKPAATESGDVDTLSRTASGKG
jgi:hypothetical protein